MLKRRFKKNHLSFRYDSDKFSTIIQRAGHLGERCIVFGESSWTQLWCLSAAQTDFRKCQICPKKILELPSMQVRQTMRHARPDPKIFVWERMYYSQDIGSTILAIPSYVSHTHPTSKKIKHCHRRDITSHHLFQLLWQFKLLWLLSLYI